MVWALCRAKRHPNASRERQWMWKCTLFHRQRKDALIERDAMEVLDSSACPTFPGMAMVGIAQCDVRATVATLFPAARRISRRCAHQRSVATEGNPQSLSLPHDAGLSMTRGMLGKGDVQG
jgi:hypothetical protein